jgi:hypothetical protein
MVCRPSAEHKSTTNKAGTLLRGGAEADRLVKWKTAVRFAQQELCEQGEGDASVLWAGFV